VDLCDLNNPALNLARGSNPSSSRCPGRGLAAIPNIAHLHVNTLPGESNSLWGWLRKLCNLVGLRSVTDTIGNAIPFDIYDNLGSMTDLNNDPRVNRRGDKGRLDTSPFNWYGSDRSLDSLINVIGERRLFASLVFIIIHDIVNFGFNVTI